MLLIVAALVLIKPGWWTDLVGLVLIALTVASQTWLRPAAACQGIHMTIQLYAFDTPNGRKISVALEEMGLPYEVHVVDITKGEQHEPRVRGDQPEQQDPGHRRPRRTGRPADQRLRVGRDPDLPGREDGQVLAVGPGRRRCAVLEWLMFQMGGFGPMPGQVHHFLGLKDEADRRYGLQRYSTETRRLYGVMDERLAGNAFFAGEALSIADFAILGWAWRHERHQVDLAEFPHVKRWYDGLMARPDVQRGFAVALRHPA